MKFIRNKNLVFYIRGGCNCILSIINFKDKVVFYTALYQWRRWWPVYDYFSLCMNILAFSHFFHLHSHDLGADLLLSRFIRKVLNLLVSLCRSNFTILYCSCCCHFRGNSMEFMWNLQILICNWKKKLWKFIHWIFHSMCLLHSFLYFYAIIRSLALMTKMFIESIINRINEERTSAVHMILM